jgi:hypothetical protein
MTSQLIESTPIEFDRSVASALGVIRTHGPLLRKQMLYPLSYEGRLG